ncbi:pyridoxal-phosphate dependent enzyme, partial [Salmonella enterica subsp. enterica serovar Anatum]|nr:pyridoxal-phosphate dependent enzyme [Salmonella enterica subsp. enterica serovar Anatum]
PYDDPKVIAGQGTIGLEIMEDLYDVDNVIVPIGGGGLIAGIAHRQLADAYAACARIDARQLWRQIRLWHPWGIMLKAGWFEYRW